MRKLEAFIQHRLRAPYSDVINVANLLMVDPKFGDDDRSFFEAMKTHAAASLRALDLMTISTVEVGKAELTATVTISFPLTAETRDLLTEE